jgi:hypothetical protein
MTTTAPLTVADLAMLSELSDACSNKSKVRWAANGDVSYIAEGVARNFTDANGNFLKANEDVRDAFVWISGTMEHFIPVRQIMEWMTNGLFVVQERN